MKKLLVGIGILVSLSSFSNEAYSKTIVNPKMKLSFINSWGYENTEVAFFSCDSDIDLVCKTINPEFTKARDFECSLMKMSSLKNLVSSSMSAIGNGIESGIIAISNIGCEEEGNCVQKQWASEPGELVVIYNLQERNLNKLENMQKYPYSKKEGKIGDISIESFRNSYYEKAYAVNDIEHLSKIECLKN